jgi:hypothetical protein
VRGITSLLEFSLLVAGEYLHSQPTTIGIAFGKRRHFKQALQGRKQVLPIGQLAFPQYGGNALSSLPGERELNPASSIKVARASEIILVLSNKSRSLIGLEHAFEHSIHELLHLNQECLVLIGHGNIRFVKYLRAMSWVQHECSSIISRE